MEAIEILIPDIEFQINCYRYTYRDPETYLYRLYISGTDVGNHFIYNLPNNTTRLTIGRIKLPSNHIEYKRKYPLTADDLIVHPDNFDFWKLFNNLPMSLELIEVYDIEYSDAKMLSDEELTERYFRQIPYGCKVKFCGRKYNNTIYRIQDILNGEKYMRTHYYGKFKGFLDAPTQV